MKHDVDDVQAAKQMWSIGLCEFHGQLARTQTLDHCATHLTVWWPYGLAFEFTATLAEHVIHRTNFTERRPLEQRGKILISTIVIVTSKMTAINSLHTVCVCVSGKRY